MSKLLNNIKEALKVSNGKSTTSFLEVIDKSSDENIVSKYLLYLLTNNIDLLNYILYKAYKDKCVPFTQINESYNEYVISDLKRIDIFIKGVDENNNDALVIIENKIYSNEHDNQCNYYFDYFNSRFKDYKKYYLLIYPSFNISIRNSVNEHFVKMTYDEINEYLEQISNRNIFEEDFKTLIENKLGNKPMDELKELFIENHDRFKNLIKEIDKDISLFMNDFKNFFLKSHLNFKDQLVENNRTLRLYKNNSSWRNDLKTNEKERVYFYVEIKCEDNLNFYFQRTLKIYSNDKESPINKYISSLPYPVNLSFNSYYVFERIPFKSSFKTLTNEWKNELINLGSKTLDELIRKQEKEIENYYEFLKKLD